MAARTKNRTPEVDEVIGETVDETGEAYADEYDSTEAPAGNSTTSRGAKRNNTFSANASLDIDFDAPAELEDLQTERDAQRSMWVRKLDALRDGIETGKGEWDKFYRLGFWPAPAGATNVIRVLGKRALPGIFQLEARVFNQDGRRVSELWASMPADQTGESEEWAEPTDDLAVDG